MRIDIISFLRFPLRGYVHVWYEISPVCCLKYLYSYFSSHFCFLVLVVVLFVSMLSDLLLAAVISLSLLFLCSPRVLVLIHHIIFNVGESNSNFFT